jgi:metallo-beta-lactamase class B
MKSRFGTSLVAAAAAMTLTVCAGPLSPAGAADTQDPADSWLGGTVLTHFAAAFKAAGTEHFNLYNMLCPRIDNGSAGKIATPQNVNQRNIDEAKSAKVFDNLYYIGEGGVWESSASAWAIETSEGIILIDALTPTSGPVLIERGLKEQGLDPEDVKYLVISHNHSDHIGGARYLQDKYDIPVVMSEAEWNGLRPGANSPRRDHAVEIQEGDTLTLGDQTINFHVTPGHTPGTLSFTFPVYDNGERHVVAEWGGTGFNALGQGEQRRIGLEGYYHSALRFRGLAEQAGADVIMANHPGLDNTYAKLAALENREEGDPHPFVIGQEKTLNYMTTAAECAAAGAVAQERPLYTTTLDAGDVELKPGKPTTLDVTLSRVTATGWVLVLAADDETVLGGGPVDEGGATVSIGAGIVRPGEALTLHYSGDALHKVAELTVRP